MLWVLGFMGYWWQGGRGCKNWPFQELAPKLISRL